ncbi:hypothetical protein [Arachidicoccus soli]|uniref:Phage protein Gp138 N-terminal domain-containing protein n=1 Tax=Arachidicoccus soli TaxID=2341117 RepID=A0A386HQH9_9BACT|nr:hypothetical protein [Arachidicoccus soli]AYD48198.1 hypothetical protein D6B99_11680 [Arachidicoccus soli]
MTKEEEIRKRLYEIAAQYSPAPTLLAKVKSVAEDTMVCVLTDTVSGQDIPNVRLRPVLDGGQSLTLIPSIGAWGFAARIENTDSWALIDASQFDKWRINVAQAVLEQSANGLLVQNGTDKLSDALNLIIDAVSQIIVFQGQNPDYVKLEEAKTKIQNILQ